jgi:signal transduction histidine kinase
VEAILSRLREIEQENQRLFQRLTSGELRFRSLARSVWRVQEEERRRLARELHDGLGQTLTALKIRLDTLATGAGAIDPDASELSAAAEIAAHALSEIRQLAHQLRPRVLDDLGLAPALHWLARTFGEWTGVEMALELEGLPEGADAPRLDRELETLVFRTTQEAVNNAVKHANVRRVDVSVLVRASRLRLVVADQGVGFNLEDLYARQNDEEPVKADGFGLGGMRDRAELFGGRFELWSQPGEGTVVTVELPMPGERQAREGRR